MARGTSSNSGPAPDPNSLRGAKRGSIALPPEGYDGGAPPYPMPWLPEVEEREAYWWNWAWKQPQAAQWAKETWRWAHVANWTRAQALAELEGTTAADRTALLRLAEEVGLTTAGLARNGWTIAKRAEPAKPEQGAPITGNVFSMRDRANRLASGS